MKEYLKTLFNKASQKIPELKEINLIFDIPKSEEHGDLSTNVAMLLTKRLKRNPRTIAQELIDILEIDKNIVTKIEIAGPGFINFFFNPAYLPNIIREIVKTENTFGKTEKYKSKKANVEFVSANPTGPLTVGHGRNTIVGDTIANMLEWIGYEVDREYYFNNAGRQMRVLGDSLRIRYLQLLGENVDLPNDYYKGEYLKDIALKLKENYGDSLKNESAEGKFKEFAEQEIFKDIKQTLDKLDIHHKIFFNENSLYQEGKIEEILETFKKENLSYESENAVWLRLSELGKAEDKVIVKSSGEPTYRLPDIAYHADKLARGYDLIVDIFGSDHEATYPDVLAGCEALGYDISKVRVIIHQFVTLLEGAEKVKMSTREANFITLDELINEVGKDVVRYFFNMQSVSSHINFDLDLAKERSEKNPVFNIQYAHARFCSIERETKKENLEPSLNNLELLVGEVEQELIKKLHDFPDRVLSSTENLETHMICNYLQELAKSSHRFHRFCRILGTEKNLAEARLALVLAARTTLKNGLSILGVSAPERM